MFLKTFLELPQGIPSEDTRFVELMQVNILPLTLYMKTCCLGQYAGISLIDSTPIRACKTKRIKQNRVFKDIATIGKSTMGWFYGFKLHIIVNDKGELLDFIITQANVDDRTPLKKGNFFKENIWKLICRKGLYIQATLCFIIRPRTTSSNRH